MRQREGSALILLAATATTLVLMLSLVIDVGFWYSRRAERQLAADIAGLGAMASVDTARPLSEQQSMVRRVCQGILSANGHDLAEWTVDAQPDAGGTYVERAIVSNQHRLPTFFWSVFSSARPLMRTDAVVEAIRQKVAVPPCAIIATGSADYSGAGAGVLDSFDSGAGGYTATSLLDGKAFDRNNATICANGPVRFNGNVAQFGTIYSYGDASLVGGAAVIDGDVFAGGLVDVNQSTVTGEAASNADVPHFVLPPPEVPPDIATVNDNGLITIESNGSFSTFAGVTLTLGGQSIVHLRPGGDYYFRAVRLTGGSSMVIDGSLADIRNAGRQTRIFVDGDFSVLGGIQFAAALAAPGTDLGGLTALDLEIVGIATSGDITIGGGSKIVADIYAPLMDVTLAGEQHTFGRIRAHDITIDGNANFTFDEALGYGGADTDTFAVRAHLVL